MTLPINTSYTQSIAHIKNESKPQDPAELAHRLADMLNSGAINTNEAAAIFDVLLDKNTVIPSDACEKLNHAIQNYEKEHSLQDSTWFNRGLAELKEKIIECKPAQESSPELHDPSVSSPAPQKGIHEQILESMNRKAIIKAFEDRIRRMDDAGELLQFRPAPPSDGQKPIKHAQPLPRIIT